MYKMYRHTVPARNSTILSPYRLMSDWETMGANLYTRSGALCVYIFRVYCVQALYYVHDRLRKGILGVSHEEISGIPESLLCGENIFQNENLRTFPRPLFLASCLSVSLSLSLSLLSIEIVLKHKNGITRA